MENLRPLTLSFYADELEQAYEQSTLDRLRVQGRVAIGLGAVLYLILGLLDTWFVPPEYRLMAWVLRSLAIGYGLFVLLLSFSRHFEAAGEALLTLVGALAGICLLVIVIVLPPEIVPNYFPAMILVTIFTYDFLGIRFVQATAVNLLLMASYLPLLGARYGYGNPMLVSQAFFLVSANVIGGATAYLVEWQRRTLFLHRRELDAERQHHLNRSLHDPLTGLPNRELLQDRLSQAITLGRREARSHCGFFVDLDGFKQINDLWGHEAGDRALHHVAQALAYTVRESDTVARLGGDEFFVVALNVPDTAAATELGRKLIDAIGAPIPGTLSSLRLGASIGACLFPYEGVSVQDVISKADQAMYNAKQAGKNTIRIAT